ncbi:MAG: C39 family peptidase [Bacteroidales bacterium]|jgi:hypothetical protein|nr:C39 family peptidase [Bacteroidales bacterium]
MKEKKTFLTKLKKYLKIGCLLLVLGGAGVVGVAQTKIIDLKQYFQTDDIWKCDIYGNNSKRYPGVTSNCNKYEIIKNLGCGMASATMIASAKGSSWTPQNVNTYLRDNDKYNKTGDTPWGIIPNLGNSGGIEVENLFAEFSITEIRKQIDEGDPVIVRVKGSTEKCGHFVLFYGYKNGGNQLSDFLIYDPAHNTPVTANCEYCDRMVTYYNVAGYYTGPHDEGGGPMKISVCSNLIPRTPKHNVNGDYDYYEYNVGDEIDFSIVNGGANIQPLILMLEGTPNKYNIEERASACHIIDGTSALDRDINLLYTSNTCDQPTDYWYSFSPYWENRWVKIIPHNTQTNDWGTPLYVYVRPNTDAPEISNASINLIPISGVDFNSMITFDIIGINYTPCTSCDPGCASVSEWGQWDRNIIVKIGRVAGEPPFPGGDSEAIGDRLNGIHDPSIPNRYSFKVPRAWAKNDGSSYQWIKIWVGKKNGNSDSKYIKIKPAGQLDIRDNDEPDDAIEMSNPVAPLIGTDYNNCYREKSTINVTVSNVESGDKVQLYCCRLPYETHCDCSICSPTTKFETDIKIASGNSVSFNLQLPILNGGNWAGQTLKIKAVRNQTTENKWSNDIYVDVRKKDNGVSYLTRCDYKEAFDNPNSYNWRFAYWCGKVAEASYDNGNNVVMATMGFENITWGIGNTVEYDIGEKWIDGKKYIMISIKGTNPANVWNLITDISVWPKNWNTGKATNPLNQSNPHVHWGFYESAKAIWEKIWTSWTDATTIDKKASYIITGHSLGGAIAELISLHLAEKGVKSNQIICYGFASPPVGNEKLLEIAQDKNIRNRIHKLWNTEDCIPKAGVNALSLAQSITEGQFTQTCVGANCIPDFCAHDMLNIYLEKLRTNALTWE